MRAENRVERSGAVSGSCRKNDGTERSAEREVAERGTWVTKISSSAERVLSVHAPLT